jgi:PAS domain S-box-containing protein
MNVTRYDLQRPAEQGGGFEERYWQITHYPILDGAGNLRFILQRPEDITERHRAALRQQDAERTLVEVQQQADFILENLPILVATTPPAGPSNYFNRRWRDFTGRPTAELLANRWTECVHPDDKERLMGWRDTQSQTPTEAQIEFRLLRHDGAYRWMLARSLSHFGSDGRLRLRVSCTVDIQDQKNLVQEMLDTAEQQAMLSEQAHHAFELAQNQRDTFYQFFMQAPALICILRGPEHRYEFVNPGYQLLFPHRPLVGRTVAEALPEVIEQGFIRILDDVYHTGQTFYGNEVPIRLERDASGELRETYLNFTYQQFGRTTRPSASWSLPSTSPNLSSPAGGWKLCCRPAMAPATHRIRLVVSSQY